ncbi:MAG TPA: proton-conducting transporter membrane subunit [Mycobacteriales bacterium]|nr:proton-conducting transporter membrane subunit [Mycobacteriales bacterium]
MSAVVVAVLCIGFAAALVCLVAPPVVMKAVTIIAGVGSLGLALSLVPTVATRDVTASHYLRVDALSLVFVLATAVIYALVSVYTVGYVEGEHGGQDVERYLRRFYVGINVFGASMLAAPLVDGLALLWIAIEVTTVVSALLVAIDISDTATEAAWKYLLIASVGLGVALLATIVMDYAGSQVFGTSFDLSYLPLIHAGHQLPATPVRLAFVLAVMGFGTKVGLVPMHTWLPDAHAEAPTPVSAMLSGALLTTSFYAVLRYFQIARGALGSAFPREVMLAFGIVSLLLAALYLLDQHDIKRLFAYSSIEHMGVLTIGMSFASPLALFGVLLHVIAHAAAKGNAFMGAGVMVRKYGGKRLADYRGGLSLLPWTGPLLLASVLALSASPPSAIFRSEFSIVAGGFADGGNAAAAVLVALVTVAFVGLTLASTRILFAAPPRPGPGADSPLYHPGEPSIWMVIPMVGGVAILVLLGVHVPGDLAHVLSRGAAELGGAR